MLQQQRAKAECEASAQGENIPDSKLSKRSPRLDLVVLEATLLAGKRHEHHILVVRDLGEQETGYTLKKQDFY